MNSQEAKAPPAQSVTVAHCLKGNFREILKAAELEAEGPLVTIHTNQGFGSVTGLGKQNFP